MVQYHQLEDLFKEMLLKSQQQSNMQSPTKSIVDFEDLKDLPKVGSKRASPNNMLD